MKKFIRSYSKNDYSRLDIYFDKKLNIWFSLYSEYDEVLCSVSSENKIDIIDDIIEYLDFDICK